MSGVDERISRLLGEVERIRALNRGTGQDHKHPDLVRWYSRSKAAIADKVGEDSHLFADVKGLQFWGFSSVYEDPTPEELREYFERDVGRIVGALEAALESEPKRSAVDAPLVNVTQHQVGASATSSATVQVQMGVRELREAIVHADELTPAEQGEAIASLPENDAVAPTLDNVERLLGIATKAESLLRPILGWVLMNADRIRF